MYFCTFGALLSYLKVLKFNINKLCVQGKYPGLFNCGDLGGIPAGIYGTEIWCGINIYRSNNKGGSNQGTFLS